MIAVDPELSSKPSDICTMASARFTATVRASYIASTSERLLNRQQAERAFRGLNIRVTGVVAKKRNSVAIVNNRVVARGDLIRGGERGDNAIVDEIILSVSSSGFAGSEWN